MRGCSGLELIGMRIVPLVIGTQELTHWVSPNARPIEEGACPLPPGLRAGDFARHDSRNEDGNSHAIDLNWFR